MGVNLESVHFDPAKFEKELKALDGLLKSKKNLSETADIQPLFSQSKHLSSYLGTTFPELGPATELAFEYPFFGDFKADLLVGCDHGFGHYTPVAVSRGRKTDEKGHDFGILFSNGWPNL